MMSIMMCSRLVVNWGLGMVLAIYGPTIAWLHSDELGKEKTFHSRLWIEFSRNWQSITPSHSFVWFFLTLSFEFSRRSLTKS